MTYQLSLNGDISPDKLKEFAKYIIPYIRDFSDSVEGKEYIVQRIETDDEELDAFLFSLGCYSGEPITVISRKRSGCVVSIKDGRYNIDNQLAEAIIV